MLDSSNRYLGFNCDILQHLYFRKCQFFTDTITIARITTIQGIREYSEPITNGAKRLPKIIERLPGLPY